MPIPPARAVSAFLLNMTAVNTQNLAVGSMDHGDQRVKLPIADAGNVTGNLTILPSVPMRELLISNDDTANSITFTVSGDNGYSITFTLQPLDISDERYYPFTRLDVSASGAWRYMLRCGAVQ